MSGGGGGGGSVGVWVDVEVCVCWGLVRRDSLNRLEGII